MKPLVRGRLVCCASAYTGGLAITHVVLDGSTSTLCGIQKAEPTGHPLPPRVKRWVQDEEPLVDDDCETPVEHDPCCIRCSKALDKLRAA